MNNDIKAFILKTLEKKLPISKQQAMDSYNYMESGHVDSIGVMKFVIEIEQAFNIEITAEDMVSSEFKTIGGLVNLIEQKVID